jgi:hypothetical protein
VESVQLDWSIFLTFSCSVQGSRPIDRVDPARPRLAVALIPMQKSSCQQFRIQFSIENIYRVDGLPMCLDILHHERYSHFCHRDPVAGEAPVKPWETMRGVWHAAIAE